MQRVLKFLTFATFHGLWASGLPLCSASASRASSEVTARSKTDTIPSASEADGTPVPRLEAKPALQLRCSQIHKKEVKQHWGRSETMPWLQPAAVPGPVAGSHFLHVPPALPLPTFIWNHTSFWCGNGGESCLSTGEVQVCLLHNQSQSRKVTW